MSKNDRDRIDPESSDPENNVYAVDSGNLKGLSHPLRMQLLDSLSTFGPQTASTLAERFGESSGSTSYHLRQLAKYGFVEEAEGIGNRRERWWRRIKGSIQFSPQNVKDSAAAEIAMRSMVWQINANNETLIRNFLLHGEKTLGMDWVMSSNLSQTSLNLTLEQLAELNKELQHSIDNITNRYRSENPAEGTKRPVQLQINLFPLIDPLTLPKPDDSSVSK